MKAPWIFIFLLFTSYSFGEKEPSFVTLPEVLNELDTYLDKRNDYTQEKVRRIDSLKNILHVIQTDEIRKSDLYINLFNEYKTYKYDSAYVYANHMLNLAEKLNNPFYLSLAQQQLACCYTSSGLFREAANIMPAICTALYTDSLKVEYFKLRSRLSYDMADYAFHDPFQTIYNQEGSMYMDSAIMLLPMGSDEIWLSLGLKRTSERNFEGAADALGRVIHQEDVDDHTYAIAASTLGYVYTALGDPDKAIYYSAKAAIADIRHAVKETTALNNLSRYLYERGDINRANRYIRLAIEDADFYNVRQRKIVISSILPIIEKERYGLIEKQRNILMWSIIAISLLFILLLATTLVIHKQIKKNTAGKAYHRNIKHQIEGCQ